jgi:hypothetical protein
MLNATTSTSASDAYQSVPPTAESSAAHLGDACALLALMVRSQSASQDSTKTQVQVDFKKMQELKQQLAEAIQAAKDAADHSGFFGFLSSVFGSDIAQIAGAVAAIAAVVATGGAAAPLVLMAVSVALEEGAKIGAQLGLDPKICMALSLASAAVGLCSGAGTAQSASALAGTARDVELAANITKSAANATGSALGFVAGHYHADQLEHQADAVGYQAQNDATSMDLDDAIALLQQSMHTEERETSTTSAIIQNNSEANNFLSDRI